jgi:glycosyltransferase involved in cell wall biosynthesis
MESYFSGFRDSVDDLRPLLGETLNDLMKIPVDRDTRVKTIASNLNTLLADEHVKTIRPKLRQIAVENYDWSLRATQMVDTYRAFIST